MWRKLLGGLTVVIVLIVAAAGYVLVPGEAVRPPPATIAAPNLMPLPAPFTHRWSKATSHPLLAAAAIDIDSSGGDAVFLGGSDGQPDALLVWREGQLVDIAAEVGLGDDQATYGALSTDIDGDGRVDLLTVGHAGLDLWINRGGRFERKPITIEFLADSVPMAITAGDFDRDGKVDLYISVFVSPAKFRSPVFNDAAHAKRNVLLRNMGNLAFADVTDAVTGGLQNTFLASFVDLDGDGWLDLVLAQNTGEAEILRNLGNGKFARVDIRTGYGFWMGLAFADIDADGDIDIFVSNVGNSIPTPLVKGDRRDDQTPANEWLLLRNDGTFRFHDITVEAGISGFGFGWGAAFEDVNLDGIPDLLVAENYVKWPVHRVLKLPGKLLLGGGTTPPRYFTSDAAANPSFGHVPLIADLDGDGRNDIVWANMDGPPRVYLNRTDGRFLSVRLPDTPRSIGARIRLEGVRAPVHVHVAGDGLTSDRSTQFTIGFPKGSPTPNALIIDWLDGTTTRIEAPPLNRTIPVRAPQRASRCCGGRREPAILDSLSFRKPCPAQALGKSCQVLRAAKRDHIPDVGDAERRIQLANAGHSRLRLRQTLGERAACRDHAQSAAVVRAAPHGSFRPRGCVVVTPRNEVTERDAVLKPRHALVDRAQPHRPHEMFDRHVGLATPSSDIAADVPRIGEVRIEDERAIDVSKARVEIADDMGKCVSALAQGASVVLSELHGA
jgi:hypothetical protein